MPHLQCWATQPMILHLSVSLLLSATSFCPGRCQSHFTRGVQNDRGTSELMTPPYQRRQDEYHLSLNCTPPMQHPAATAAAYQVELNSGGRLHPSSGSRLTWLVKPPDAYDYIGDYLPLIAFSMTPGCARADPVTVVHAAPAGEYMALVEAQGCGVYQIVRAVRLLYRQSRVFMLHGLIDRSLKGDVPDDQHHLSLCVFVYEQTPLAAQLARELRNRTCSVSLSFRLGGLDSLINRTSVLFVSVSFILLMIISLSWLVFYYVQRFRYLHAKERLSRRLGNAAKKALIKIPVRILKPGDRDFTWIGDQCAVCIEPYRVSDSVRILPCKHFYHRSCIDPWLLDQRTCPLCKLDILKAYGLQIRDHRGSRGSLLDGRLTPENSQAAESVADSVGIVAGCLGRPSTTAASSTSASASAASASVAGAGASTAAAAGASSTIEDLGCGGVVRLSSHPNHAVHYIGRSHQQHHQRQQTAPISDEEDLEPVDAAYGPLVHHHQRMQQHRSSAGY